MNFDDLQDSWKAQPVRPIEDSRGLRTSFQSKWQKYQHSLLKKTICMSLCLLATLIGIGWVYLAYRHEFGWPFTASIASTCTIILIFILVNWRSYAFKKENLAYSGTDFIKYQLQKLNWHRKIITSYYWAYSILLWLSMVMYLWEVTKAGSSTFRYTALAVTTAYIAGISIWHYRKKQKKQLAEVDELIAELENIRKNWLMEGGDIL